MSAVSDARRQLAGIKSQLRYGQLLPATQALRNALVAVMGQPLMKNERAEFENLFATATQQMNSNPYLRKIYPLELVYAPGNEKQLSDNLAELLSMLQDEAIAEAENAAQLIAEKKAQALAKGQEFLDGEEFDAARAVFQGISDEHPDDGDLKADIGERVFKAGLYEDAVAYLGSAIELDPGSVHYYNRLGIALRKIGRFDTAEMYYLRALQLAPEDAYLHFNTGRLYLEWRRWNKAIEHAELACALEPSLEEARKLAAYCRQQC